MSDAGRGIRCGCLRVGPCLLFFFSRIRADSAQFAPMRLDSCRIGFDSCRTELIQPKSGRIGCRPIRPDKARFWPNQPGSTRIEADSARIKPHRRKSSRVSANPRKKKNADAVRRAGNRVGHRIPRRATSDAGAAPLVQRPCFLGWD